MVNFWDERYYVVVIFPLQKMTKMSWNCYSEHLEKITESAQNPENASKQSCENYRSWPKTIRSCKQVPVANSSFQARFLLVFWIFWPQFGPKLKPNDQAQVSIDIKWKTRLRNTSFGGWVLPKTLVPSIPFILFSSLLISFLQSSTFLPPFMPQ